MAASGRPSAEDVRNAIGRALARGLRSTDDVAQLLHVSRSTLERGLQDEGVEFKQLRRDVQLEIALELLTSGASAAHTATEVCVTRDHLCVIVRAHTGLTPYQLIRAVKLAEKVGRWQEQGPPAYGSAWYRAQFDQWRAIDDELQRLFGDLGPDHPLADWAKKLLLAVERPDYRRAPHRARLRSRRAEKAAADVARLKRFVDAMEQARLPGEQRSAFDIYRAGMRVADAA
jgi:AraC-like DNA-binding protein